MEVPLKLEQPKPVRKLTIENVAVLMRDNIKFYSEITPKTKFVDGTHSENKKSTTQSYVFTKPEKKAKRLNFIKDSMARFGLKFQSGETDQPRTSDELPMAPTEEESKNKPPLDKPTNFDLHTKASDGRSSHQDGCTLTARADGFRPEDIKRCENPVFSTVRSLKGGFLSHVVELEEEPDLDDSENSF